MVHLTTHERVTLMADALRHAADAFAKLTHTGIALRQSVSCQTQDILLAEEEFYVLTTEVKGNLQGRSYLLLTVPEAVWVIRRMNIEIAPNAEWLSAMQQSALLELDNVLSAAAVTQIANQLDVFCYGDVPLLQKMDASQLRSVLAAAEQQYPLLLHTGYESTDCKLAAAFIWMFAGTRIQPLAQTHL